MGISIEELSNDLDVILLLESWEHDTERIQCLENYNVHCLMWVKNVRQQKGQGGVACLIESESVKYVSIEKIDQHKL